MSKRKAKKKKVKIAHCAWCRKVLKAGSYTSEGRDDFCGNECLSEWKVKQAIVLRQLEGQKSLVEKRGESVKDLEEKAHKQKLEAIKQGDLKKGEQITVDELLETTADEKELESIAGRLFGVKVRKTYHPLVYVAAGAVFALLLMIAATKITSSLKENETTPDKAKKDSTSIRNHTLKPADTVLTSYKKEVTVNPVEKEERAVRAPLSAKPQPLITDKYESTLNFSRGNIDVPDVALTFDAGAHLEETGAILDTLKSRNIKCTFFLTGYYAKKYSSMVRRMVAEGHEIGNHTTTHPHLTTFETSGTQTTSKGVNKSMLLHELNSTDTILASIAGSAYRKIWRAPYGEMNRDICAWAEEGGYKHVGWTQGNSWRTNLDTNDWIEYPSEQGFFYPQEVVDKIMKFGTGTGKGLNGGIVLMHAGTLRKKHKMVEYLGVLIDSLQKQNYSL
ncbi:MAG: polysaccharide deacetylase family protein, partial [Fibrobacteres bacterium]|nr:polysaccharide deacetylase family protein [Fibrobacterota bacterium]